MKKLFLLLAAIMTLSLSAYSQERSVKGTVVDSETDEPMIGATVMPLGGGVGTATDIDGHFSLSIPAHVKEIQVSYVGYKTERVRVEPNMIVKLVSDNRLNEVVVTGYGSGKKLGSIVGSVSVVGEEALENVPTASFIDALQGQVSGLSIASASGDPSSDHNSVRLRGVNSLQAGNTPLYILDGAPVTSAVFNTLNPNDIESVTVLKDAASVAIYGSRAANGVIVITSKRGKFGEKARVTIRANVGWSQRVNDKLDLMNAKEYLKYRELIGQPCSDDQYFAVNELGVDTDWMKETFDSHALLYSLEANVQGGSESLGYYLSLNHYDSEGIIAQSKMRRETLRFSLRTKVNDWLRLGLQSNLGYTKYQTNAASNTIYSGGGIYLNNPMVFATAALPTDATRYWWREGDQVKWGERSMFLHFSQLANPDLYLKDVDTWRTNTTANITLWEQINPIQGLTLRAQQNLDAFDYRGKSISYPNTPFTTPMGDYFDYYGSTAGRNSQAFQRYYAWTYTNTAEYNRAFGANGQHDMTILLGQESIIKKSDSFGVYASGYSDPRTMLLPQAGNVKPEDLSQSISSQSFNSFFVNGAYNYDTRYFVEATFRRDGSSIFAPGHRWSNFYSFGAMWALKQEKFMAPYTWIDDLKLHVSYGTTGNSSISNYMFYGLVGQFSTNYNGAPAWGVAQQANEKLSWETVRSFDVGVNFGFLKIFSGEVNFYNKNTVDMLMSIPYSYTTGFGSGFGNIGSMRNTGVDVDVRADIIKSKDWYWGVRANFNYNHNEITKLYDDMNELVLTGYGLKYEVGHGAGELYTVRYAGVDPMDGQQMWYDKDGNLTKVYNEEEDAVLLGKSKFAPWHGGFGTTVRWKDLSLQVDFNWAAKKYMMNNQRYFSENNTEGMTQNQMSSMLNVWTTPGQQTLIPAADGQARQFDTHLVENSSYMRLKNLTLTYSLPQSLCNKLYLEGVSFHFTGRNLLTFTGFTGMDPEPETNNAVYNYPNTRQYEFGLEVNF